MGMYYLKNKYFEGVAFGKSIQADNLFSSYLDIFFLCYNGQVDKEQKVFNMLTNHLFIGDIAKSPSWFSGRASHIAMGWGANNR